MIDHGRGVPKRAILSQTGWKETSEGEGGLRLVPGCQEHR